MILQGVMETFAPKLSGIFYELPTPLQSCDSVLLGLSLIGSLYVLKCCDSMSDCSQKFTFLVLLLI